jgi:hypothetical protein
VVVAVGDRGRSIRDCGMTSMSESSHVAATCRTLRRVVTLVFEMKRFTVSFVGVMPATTSG